ncbi:MAG: type II toxin-antitoxin system death-on-curing family toxin [Solirubrobacterales bacterium]|nr:type II toxin-antitoxin system death-on-curing family toxin [Solirubrobacterales bacterium]
MENINWLRPRDILGAHSLVIEFSDGSDGVRDTGSLESALARPQNIHAYEPEAPLTRLAAAYGYGIASNHPFVDGNKRAAFIAIELFLDLHDISVEASEEKKYMTMMSLASGELDEAGLFDWLDQHTAPPADSE